MSESHNGSTPQPNPTSQLNSLVGLGARGMGAASPWMAAGNISGGLIQRLVDPNHSGNSFGNIAGATLKGAGTGAAVGSVVPGIGTLIGAGVGGLAGGLSTLL
ncbi:hypothetical protein [Burkholderia multivorans]|uniref:hypothetical protein n=1 Tax=Burkholderia multivorans TaxID=87883 RepID=UPI0013DEBECB|nr:hypothetical protein [Burkholderia multivorans]MCO1461214.1 hypothetical protein [Burkholderia multivorans]MDN7448022.1 hypothetical protein [Burkholderia multivorans]NGM79698.1 hypothetical protein [Burkholderia multivorans]HEM7839654.1 hypothetical protein [Burkholderia multivorans]HEM7869927.1 hypothetical protein [Burkholderia multivorans]